MSSTILKDKDNSRDNMSPERKLEKSNSKKKVTFDPSLDDQDQIDSKSLKKPLNTSMTITDEDEGYMTIETDKSGQSRDSSPEKSDRSEDEIPKEKVY